MAQMHRVRRAAAAALLGSALFSGIPAASAASTQAAGQTGQTYLVVYTQLAVPADAAASVARAGGRLVTSYDAIGVALATSNATTFRDELKKDARVDDAGQTAFGAVKLKDRVGDDNDEGPSATS